MLRAAMLALVMHTGDITHLTPKTWDLNSSVWQPSVERLIDAELGTVCYIARSSAGVSINCLKGIAVAHK